ncbi:sensor domain-containing diguanylate cyclase [Sphingomonas immobilis]|uniref:Sensor domain-containing diguanylate cyclase n=1 Tax=Sphingomonas immobilis TaxID=3063997 RepID=A0ABT9A453_9SPHN|nr:sensor domain-containing diguanylate cyclase [Sphingomonas sp. CA1-15]MDO7844323.1 sensor domain-containing diguanylate cyclase [Sphingomonas sp. CA1-15]
MTEDEAYRLSVLRSFELLDTAPEAEFDALVELARHVTGCPIALVSLVDDDRQWFKAKCGIAADETPREIAFCSHAIHYPDIMVVPDATRDPRFAENPMVTGGPMVRFYAGVPLRVSPGPGQPPAAIGTLCVIDMTPRELSLVERKALLHLASLVETIVRGRMHVRDAVLTAEGQRVKAVRIGHQHRQLRQAERLAEIGSWRLTVADQHLEWSDQVFAIHELPIGTPPSLERALDFYPPHGQALIAGVIARALETGESWDVETDFITATGTAKRVRSIGEVDLEDGMPIALVGVFQDVTERFAMEQGLRRSAHEDDLTGIANRAAFNAALDRCISEAHAAEESFALILIDLDGFKAINDTHGHMSGDELLQGIAKRLQMPYLKHCIPARLGGDEFALILPRYMNVAQVHLVAGRLLSSLRRSVEIGCGRVAVSGSIGISWHRAGTDRRALVHQADTALYEAKRAGKNIGKAFGIDGFIEPLDERSAARAA